MKFDGLFGNSEICRDLLVKPACRDPCQNLTFAYRQALVFLSELTLG